MKTLMMDSLLRPFDHPFFNDIRSDHSMRRWMNSFSHQDDESPLIPLERSNHAKDKQWRVIPIHVVDDKESQIRYKERKPVRKKFDDTILLLEDGTQCHEDNLLSSESPIPEQHSTKKLQSTYKRRSLHASDTPKKVYCEENNDLSRKETSPFSVRSVERLKSDLNSTNAHKNNDHTQSIMRDEKKNCLYPSLSDTRISSSDYRFIESSERCGREIPVIDLDRFEPEVENIKNHEQEDAATVRDYDDKNKNLFRIENDVTAAPGYPVYSVLRKKLSAEGRQIDYINADGNCFFRALSKHLYGSERYHKAVRSLIVDLIATHKDKFSQFIDDEDVQKHVMAVSEDRTWATTCEVYAAATLLQRDIYMLTPEPGRDEDHYHWLYFKPIFSMEPQCAGSAGGKSGVCAERTCYITLCNTNGIHYDRVVATHGGCNCFLPCPELEGIICNVDLTT